MYIKKYRSVEQVFSPYTYLILMWVSYLLSFIENGLSWGMMFDYYAEDYFVLYLTFTIMFFLGAKIIDANYYPKSNASKCLNFKTLWFFFIISAIFQIGKFINIGDIPLLGDPMSRYNLTLGGYEDYPSRLLAPIGMLFFASYLKYGRKVHLSATFICLLLPLLLMQRQEVLILLLGCIMIYCHDKEFSLKMILFLTVLAILIIVLGVGVMTIARYGSDSLASDMAIYEIIIWILHGELVTPIRLGAYVYDNTQNLNGLYTFGSFLSVFIPGFKYHGAEFVRVLFSDSDTAQSIGSLFGFASDFDLLGVAIISFFTSLISFLLYKIWRNTGGYYILILYPLVFLQLLWNLRSGTFILNPLMIYISLALIVLLNVGEGSKIFKVVKIIYFFTLLISFAGLAVRI